MAAKFPMKMRARELNIGDSIQLFEGAFGTAVVTKVANGQVSVFRPYAITSDFAYGIDQQVIPYTGHETVDYPTDGKATFTVYSRRPEIK